MRTKIRGYDPQGGACQRVVLTGLTSIMGSMRLIKRWATCAAPRCGKALPRGVNACHFRGARRGSARKTQPPTVQRSVKFRMALTLVKPMNRARESTKGSPRVLELVRSRPAGRAGRQRPCQHFAYDAVGQVTGTYDALSNVAKQYFDGADNVTGVTDANGNCTHFTFDALNRVTSCGPTRRTLRRRNRAPVSASLHLGPAAPSCRYSAS
jgi:YD repeat-containing protein